MQGWQRRGGSPARRARSGLQPL